MKIFLTLLFVSITILSSCSKTEEIIEKKDANSSILEKTEDALVVSELVSEVEWKEVLDSLSENEENPSINNLDKEVWKEIFSENEFETIAEVNSREIEEKSKTCKDLFWTEKDKCDSEVYINKAISNLDKSFCKKIKIEEDKSTCNTILNSILWE